MHDPKQGKMTFANQASRDKIEPNILYKGELFSPLSCIQALLDALRTAKLLKERY